jgi:hypothetical protein
VRQLPITDEPAHRALHERPVSAMIYAIGCPMCSVPIEPDSHTLDGMHPDCALTPDTVALSCVLADRARAARRDRWRARWRHRTASAVTG